MAEQRALGPTDGSWVPVPDGSDFPLANLPYGVFRRAGTGEVARVGVAIGEHVLDLSACERAGELGPLPEGTFARSSLNTFMALGRPVWSTVRRHVQRLLAPGSALEGSFRQVLTPMADCELLVPFQVADYADFYSSEHHARNMGEILRPGSEPLLPNWKHLPVGYHGRAGTVVVSSTPIHRPSGLRVEAGGDQPVYGPSRALDIELELGAVVGTTWPMGAGPIAPDRAADHVFGFVLLNDWSARDIQAYEYQPLGPFLGKSFATTVSPWVVPLDALAPHLVDPPLQDPVPATHLVATTPWGLDIELEVELNGTVVSRSNARHLYWTFAQQLAHLTSNGAGARPGDLLGSGTISGPEPGSYGSLMELTWRGRDPLVLADGATRTFLQDGDTVTLRGWAGGAAVGGPPASRIGFGECIGSIRPAPDARRA